MRVRRIRRQPVDCGTGDFNAGEGSEPSRTLFNPRGEDASPVVDSYRVAYPKRAEGEGPATGSNWY